MPSDNTATSKVLVSVICRSIGRELLQQALQSIADQTHPDIEVILVDAAAKDLTEAVSAFPQLDCYLVSTGTPLDRSSAANAGLQAARGEWILFLDEDDWIAADHIASLLDALQKQSGFKAAYSNVQKTDVAGNAVDTRFEQDFDPVLLMRDNYIPIHAMIFHRSLLEQGCAFDTRFDIFEDWDFWLQLNEHTAFLHLDKLTAFYRQGGESDTDISDPGLRYRDDNPVGQARASLLSKWSSAGPARKSTPAWGTGSKRIDYPHRDRAGRRTCTNLAHQEQIKGLLTDLESVRSHLAFANSKIDISQDRIAALESRIDELLNSTSWKLTAPLRKLSSAVKGRCKLPGSPEDDS